MVCRLARVAPETAAHLDPASPSYLGGILMMGNILRDGHDYTFAQFDGWCRAAGFGRTEKFPLAGPTTAAAAWK